MHWERYVHPEFGFLSPTPRLRRDLRTALLSLLFGIGIGATAMIALSGNNKGDANWTIFLEQHKMRCVRDQNAAFDRISPSRSSGKDQVS
jgi:hypothetical protein